MHMKSKTIILSSEKENGRGILTIFQENDLLECRIRLYNISNLNKFCKIGIYHQKQVYSANMLEKNGVYTSSLVGDFDINQDFYTAIVDTQNNNNVLLSGGTYAGYYFNDNSVFNSEFDNPSTIVDEKPPQKLSEQVSFSTCLCNENNNSEQNFDKCKSCKYKEYFYSQNTPILSDKSEDTTETLIQSNKEKNNIEIKSEKQSSEIETENNVKIFDSIVSQFKYVFENYPEDSLLTSLLPNSKFVQIKENNDEYSIGVIYSEDKIKYICYAVIQDYNSPAPTELGSHYQWLPIDKDDPLSQGYYIVFQDAHDLKIVEL